MIPGHGWVETQPEFGEALEQAWAAGVKVLFLPCKVGRDTLQGKTGTFIRKKKDLQRIDEAEKSF